MTNLRVAIRISFVPILLSLFMQDAFTQQRQTVQVTDYGYEPGSRNNVIPALFEALEECAVHDSAILVFPKGRYDFWQDFSSRSRSTIGIRLDSLMNFIFDGDGSEFIFHGNMQIMSISGCDNILVRNFSVDWDFPFMYQALYLDATDDYIDLEFDKEQYHYVIEDGQFYMTGEGWKASPTGYFDLFDRDTREILYMSHDGNNSEIFSGLAQEIAPGIVRFHGKTNIKPPKGTFTTLMAGRYITSGVSISGCKDVYLKDITIYHALSNAFYGRDTENITMDKAHVRTNDRKGRVFSSIADASHFTNCKGLIKVINCAHTGAMDDFINVHGRYMLIDSVPDHYSVISRRGSGNPGEEIWFVNAEDCQRSEPRTIKSVEYIDLPPGTRQGRGTSRRRGASKITFTTPLPGGVQAGIYMENKTWTPSVEIRNCEILKKNRARGILVTTPHKVIIENNYFRTAGTAILIEGDMDYWFESGAHKDLTIANNVFENCLTSGCITGDRWEWGEAVITITPSHRPGNEKSEPYHKNIRIENNIFKTFDTPLVHARSVRGLAFRNNEIIRTYTYEPYLWQQSSFLLDGCREVVITGNRIDAEYTTRTIKMEHMSRSDVRAEGFSIVSH
jgi:hypothetical protein